MQELYFHNTLTGKKEPFHPVGGTAAVKIYSCGPTVYDFAHIGNFRTNIFQDLLVRVFEHFGYRVEQVMNITDVDDKTIAGSIREGISLQEYTKKYTAAFLEDLDALRIKRPRHMPRATECIGDMQELIQTLIDNGHAYASNGSVYFKIDTFPGYGKLSKKKLDQNIQGARIESDEYEKDNLSDFVLWKAKKEGEPSWPSPWGDGRPGWHIECSAMSMKYFGATFDMHTGGEDLVFPHHENEIAQSEAATGKPYAAWWLHAKFLLVDGEKMSKSKGNFYTLRGLLAKGYDPVSIRYLLLSHNYRQPLNFTLDGIEQAKKAVQRINECMCRVTERLPDAGGNEDAHLAEVLQGDYRDFEWCLSDDLNVAQALAIIFDVIKKVNHAFDNNRVNEAAHREMKRFFAMVNEILAVQCDKKTAIPADISALADARAEARTAKNWVEADRLRNELDARGWVIKDTKDGYTVERK